MYSLEHVIILFSPFPYFSLEREREREREAEKAAAREKSLAGTLAVDLGDDVRFFGFLD